MSYFTTASSFVFTQETIRFFEKTIDDWIHDVPEILEFLHHCRYFAMVIEVKFTPDQKEALETLGTNAIDDDTMQATSSEPVLEFSGRSREQITSRPRLQRSNSGDTSFTRKQDRMNSWINQPIEYYQSHRLERAKADMFSSRKKSSDQSQDQIDKETAVTREIAQRIARARKFITEFMEEDDRKVTFQESINWSVQHESWASDLKRYFREETIIICGRLGDLLLCPSIKEREAVIKLDQLKRHLSSYAHQFWSRLIGQQVRTELSEFMKHYIDLFGQLDLNDQEYIESALGTKDKDKPEITVFGFINFTNKHGFPFGQNIISTTPESQAARSESQRNRLHSKATEVLELYKLELEATAHYENIPDIKFMERRIVPSIAFWLSFMKAWRLDAIIRDVFIDEDLLVNIPYSKYYTLLYAASLLKLPITTGELSNDSEEYRFMAKYAKFMGWH